ncbi:MAG: hypothetical protein GY851_13010 [bacterium]|nr:hypothetical protein [bacterium]
MGTESIEAQASGNQTGLSVDEGETQQGVGEENGVGETPQPAWSMLFGDGGFLSVGAASILYMLSALSIMYGMATLIGPVLARSGVLGQTLPCIGALNLYEVALLCVLLAIVLLRKATADAVSLTVLVALFLMATGVALDTVANDSPSVATVVAMACVALAWVKLSLLRHHVALGLRQGLFSGACLVIGWSFLTAPALAYLLKYRDADVYVLRTVLQAGWFVMLTGTVLMFRKALRTGDGEARPATGTAFIRTHGMAWVFVALLVFACAIHQYALTYVFDVPWTFGDYLPLILVCSLIGLELLRGYGMRSPGLDVSLACAPLGATIVYAVAGAEAVPSWLALDMLWQPAVLTALTVVALIAFSFRAGRIWLIPVAGAYALAFLLLLGATPGDAATLNWHAVGAAVLVVLVVAGLALRDGRLLAAAVLLLALGAWSSDSLTAWSQRYPFSRLGVIGLTTGLGLTLVYIGFPERLPNWVGGASATLLTAMTIAIFNPETDLTFAFLAGAAVAGTGALAWRRTRNPWATIAPFIPLARTVYLSARPVTGWHFVALSFLLLAIGACTSLRRRPVS